MLLMFIFRVISRFGSKLTMGVVSRMDVAFSFRPFLGHHWGVESQGWTSCGREDSFRLDLGLVREIVGDFKGDGGHESSLMCC